MKRIHILLASVIFVQLSFAQQNFIRSGRIVFEQKLAQMSLIESLEDKADEGGFMEEMKKSFPRMVTDHFLLDFNPEGSWYRLEKENPENKYLINYGMFGKPDQDGYTLQDFTAGFTTRKMMIFENNYLLKDSLMKYDWKITGELREIAGFQCKKAITRISDSVVVVAFYTDEITASGGPGSFHGLPGMILGIAVPRLSLNIFATRLESANQVSSIPFPQPAKPKPITRKQMAADIAKGIKGWGKWGNIIRWSSLL
jgi:GLPGLI family protein